MDELSREINERMEALGTDLSLLSPLGRRFYAPRGVTQQTAEAKGCELNGTIGVVADASGSPWCLRGIQDFFAHDCLPQDLVSYAPVEGVKKLREKWRERQGHKGKNHITLPVVTQGLTHGLMIGGDLFLDSEKICLLPYPRWGNYDFIWAQRSGARIVSYPFSHAGHLGAAIQPLLDVLSQQKGRSVVLLLNSPHNPTGYHYTTEEQATLVAGLVDLVDDLKSLVVICDDAYSGLMHGNKAPLSLFEALAQVHPNILAVKIDGASKELLAWGLRIGFITIGSQNLSPPLALLWEDKLSAAVRSSVSTVALPSQMAVLKALESPDLEADTLLWHRNLKERFEAAFQEAQKGPWDLYPAQAGYFLCMKLHSPVAEKVRCRLLEKKIGIISLGNDHLRVAYSSLEKESIPVFFEKIRETIEEITSI